MGTRILTPALLLALIAAAAVPAAAAAIPAKARLPAPAPAEGEAFHQLSFADAAEHAQQEGKPLLVDFTASWCPPCRRMERTTWVQPEVIEWLGQHVVAIQVDIDEQGELAGRHAIEAIPTLIVFRDGNEFDRTLGYQSGEDLLAWLQGVVEGRREDDALAEAAEGSDVSARHDLARSLLRRGELDGALEQYLWLWNESLQHDPSWVGMRSSLLLNEIPELSRRHAPAQEAFATVLDLLEQKVRSRLASGAEWRDLAELGPALARPDVLVELYDGWRTEGGEAARIHPVVQDALFDRLVESGRWADGARMFGDVRPRADMEVGVYRAGLAQAQRPGKLSKAMQRSLRDMYRQRCRRTLSRLHAAALAADRPRQAARVAEMLLETLDDADTRLALVDLALAVRKVGPAHHRWLGQAETLGADVSARREQLSR